MKEILNLDKCLEYAGIIELPIEWDKKTPFLKAIILVEKVSGVMEYMIGSIDDKLSIYATKCFSNDAIANYITAYPYLMLDNKIQEQEENVVKVKMDDIKTIEEKLDDSYFGIEGVITVNDAKEWIIKNGDSRLATSNKKEKLKENIEKIKNNLNTEE